ncbi:HNH endonuclease [Pseudomonas fluorescens]|uniref:Putative HNH nuclease YajD n=1 Tax=Pseudomonas fluorescens TaxID=294 RepID=A0A5E7EB90_PSEFL|nr:HNH endonuclease [Pseudomonas fluorescens]VVO24181.1 hypothetical protein PS710_04487 [Pseudomonas fluorescens]
MAKLSTLKCRISMQPGRLTAAPACSWRAGKTTSSQRGYNYEWQKARVVHLNDNPLCVYCQREGRVTAASVVDHSVPHRGDMDIFWDKSQWVSLCAHCHSSVKQQEEQRNHRQ